MSLVGSLIDFGEILDESHQHPHCHLAMTIFLQDLNDQISKLLMYKSLAKSMQALGKKYATFSRTVSS
jgi:hypothetical protein